MLKLCILSISFLLLGYHGISGILPEIRDSLGITQTQSEILVTAPSIANLLFVILSNPMIEKIGMKKTVVLGLVVSGLGGVLPAVSPAAYPILLMSRFVLGAGLGLIYTSSVAYIHLLFEERERAALIGYRSAMELVGQTLLTLAIGALAIFGWQLSFLAHGVAFLLAALFAWKVPEVAPAPKAAATDKGPISPIVYATALFLGFVALSGSMIVVRFPAMAVEIMGVGYNSSVIVAVKPMLGIVAAMSFGKLNALLGKKLLYIGLGCLVLSNLFMGIANGNFALLVLGFWLSSFVLGWIVPIMINFMTGVISGKSQRLAMSFVLVFINIALFIMPFVARGLENAIDAGNLGAPYPLMSTLIALTLGIVWLVSSHPVLRKKLILE